MDNILFIDSSIIVLLIILDCKFQDIINVKLLQKYKG